MIMVNTATFILVVYVIVLGTAAMMDNRYGLMKKFVFIACLAAPAGFTVAMAIKMNTNEASQSVPKHVHKHPQHRPPRNVRGVIR